MSSQTRCQGEDWERFKEEVNENVEEYQAGRTDNLLITAGKTARDFYQLKKQVDANKRDLFFDYCGSVFNYSLNSTKTGFRNIGSAWRFGVSNIKNIKAYGSDLIEIAEKQREDVQEAEHNMRWNRKILQGEIEKHEKILKSGVSESIEKYNHSIRENINLAKIQGYNFQRHTQHDIENFWKRREDDLKDLKKEVKEDIEEAAEYIEESIEEMPLNEKVHLALDLAGLVFEGADAANALLYAAEGRMEEAVLSGAAVIPAEGVFTTGAKWVNRFTDWGEGFSDIFKITKKGMDGVPSFTDEVVEGIVKQSDELTGEVAEKAGKEVIEGGTKTVKELISESDAAKKWGMLDDGTNQGVKHFSDYWEQYPERIPSLEQRLGVQEGAFNNSLDGFNNFTTQAERVISEATSVGNVRDINGKLIYYIDGAANPKKGVVVIVRDGKIQSMMPSDLKSFNKMQ